jgi:hypothetical protein
MNLIFALASILLVYPILSVLPLKMSAKQRLIIVGVSLIISVTGILAMELFATWQSLLLMFALVFLVSLLISKRIPEEVVKTLKPVPEESSIMNQEEVSEDNSLIETTIVNIENKLDELIDEEEDMAEINSILNFDPIVTSSNINDLEDNDLLLVDYLSEELQSHLYVAAAVESDLEDLIANETDYEIDRDIQTEDLLVVENQDDQKLEEDQNLEEVKGIREPDTSSYLSEIEKLLLEEEQESLPDKEENMINKTEEKIESTTNFKLEKLY